MDYLNEFQMRTAECQSSCIGTVFYMIKICLVWQQLCSILTDIGSRLQQLQDLLISSTDLTVSEIILLRKVSENVYLFVKMFLTDTLTQHLSYLYLFLIN